MDKLKDMLTMDPCYEQHIVSIKEIYEKHLFSILIPAIYEGYLSLYKRAYEVEKKYIIASKKNPDIENPGILVIFQTLIHDIPNLNNMKFRMETDRIKSSSKSAELFDDLVRAVCKANIILLTYNVDHKRKDLLQTKYHENIIIYDFIHSCYNQSARLFYGCTELFYHKFEPIILNQNKRACHKIIKESIEEAIRMMLPMKDILLEYNTQKYNQKDKNYFDNYNGQYGQYNHHGQYPPGYIHNGHNGYMDPNMYPDPYQNYVKVPSGVSHDEYVHINKLVDRDLKKHMGSDRSLLEDDDSYNDDNAFGPDITGAKINDFSLLLSESSDTYNDTTNDNNNEKDNNDNDNNNEKDNNNEDKSESGSNSDSATDNTIDTIDTDERSENNIKSDKNEEHENKNESDAGLRMIDISGSLTKKGAASAYFNETLPDIKKRMLEYKQTKKNTQSTTDTKSFDKKNDDNNEDIKITRSPIDRSEFIGKKKQMLKNNDSDENMINNLLKS